MRGLLLTAATVSLFLTAGTAIAAIPGVPCPGAQPNTVELFEGTGESFPFEHVGPVPLQFPAVAGFIVYYETQIPNLQDPSNWSDVVVFANGHPPSPGECAQSVAMASGSTDASGQEVGITDADLAPYGITINDVILGNTIYLQENRSSDLNQITANGVIYKFHSDPPEIPTTVKGSTWGRIKALYH